MSAPVRPELLRRLDWSASDAAERAAWIAALRPPGPTVEVQPLVDAVRSGGDEAVRDLTRRFDGVDLDSLWVSPDEISAALGVVPAPLLDAIDD
ncbi:MAG TPA: histidinol dehydrogenase, partial [Candidatus Limnocylindria bacterium]|nr:histidinol dehydrogenase [Candidatus Limnocylindria bacterium]